MSSVLTVIAAYLLGSIPFSFLIVRWRKGIDVRSIGSGNAGATNVLRAAGRGAAAAALLLDALKGVAAVLMARLISGEDPVVGLAAVAVVCGHVYPLFLGFRGGKGVATAAGALGVLSPIVFVALLLVFVAVVATTRYVSLGSVVGALSFPLFLWVGGQDEGGWILAGSVLIALLITFKHRENLVRLVQGRENRLGAARSDGEASEP